MDVGAPGTADLLETTTVKGCGLRFSKVDLDVIGDYPYLCGRDDKYYGPVH